MRAFEPPPGLVGVCSLAGGTRGIELGDYLRTQAMSDVGHAVNLQRLDPARLNEAVITPRSDLSTGFR